MKFASLALAFAAAANVQDEESSWSNQVNSDKQALSSAISNMESVGHEYREAVQNSTHARQLSLNLAETAYGKAHDAAHADKQNALNEYNKALAHLRSADLNATERKDAEKAARQKSDQVDKAFRREGDNARNHLKMQRADASKKVHDAYEHTKAAAHKLKRDSKSLERAMRKNGKSEREYEGMAQDVEQHEERLSDYAEDNRDRAADAVEHIFEHAQDHLNDREEHQQERASDERENAMQEVMDSLVRQQASKQTNKQAAVASPVASALNLIAKTDASQSETDLSAEQKRQEREQERLEKEQQRQEKEEAVQSAVDSDKSRLSHAMQKLDTVSKGFQKSVKNSTDAKALAANIAKGVFEEAAKSSTSEKEKATKDFDSYLEALKSATPTGKWSHELKTVKDQARYLDSLDRKENKMAKKMLQSKHDSQKKTVKTSYQSAHQAARDLLRDKNHLESAMRAAGAKEREYEGQEMKNEAQGERSADRSEDLNDAAHDAAEEIYERASDNLDALQRANHKEQHQASRYRHEQIHDAVMSLKYAAKGKTYTKMTAKRGDAVQGDTNELQNIETQMETLEKGIHQNSEELLASPVGFSSSCLLAVASVGLLISFYVRRARRMPASPPLLG